MSEHQKINEELAEEALNAVMGGAGEKGETATVSCKACGTS